MPSYDFITVESPDPENDGSVIKEHIKDPDINPLLELKEQKT